MIKKITALFLTAALCFSFPAYADNEKAYEKYGGEIDVLAAAGIIDKKDNTDDYDTNITQKELRGVLRNIGVSDERLREIDVFGTDYSDKGEVLKAEIVCPFVRLIGYDKSAVADGGYPNGYIKTAGRLGFFKGIDKDSNTPFTRGEAYKLIFNALSAPIYPDLTYPGEHKVDKELTFFTEKLNIYKIEGIVSATGRSTLANAAAVYDGRTRIGELDIKSEGIDTEPYFGCDVDTYCRYDEDFDEYTLLTINYDSKNVITQINSTDIVSYTSYMYRYDETERKTVNKKLPSDAEIVYNGVGITEKNAAMVNMKPDTGSVTIIENPGAAEEYVVIIKDYKAVVADGINTEEGFCTSKEFYGVPVEKISLEGLDIYDASGALTDISAVREWDVLNFAKGGDGKYLYAEISRET